MTTAYSYVVYREKLKVKQKRLSDEKWKNNTVIENQNTLSYKFSKYYATREIELGVCQSRACQVPPEPKASLCCVYYFSPYPGGKYHIHFFEPGVKVALLARVSIEAPLSWFTFKTFHTCV